MKRSYILLTASLFFSPKPLVGQNVYFGNLHSHTSYSDGSGTPSDAYKYARSTAQIDFLAITEHNHKDAERGAALDRRDGILIAKDHSLYNGKSSTSLMSAARTNTVNGKFVALYGQEFSSISRGNHINVFDVDSVIDVPNGEFGQLVRKWLPNNFDSEGKPAIIQFNHPSEFDNDNIEYGADDFDSMSDWVNEMGAQACLIEVLNGPAMAKQNGNRPRDVMEAEFLRYLNLGFHLAPTGDQDNHYETWGNTTDSRTAVLADALTKHDVLSALRNRHVYATEDKNLRLVFRVNGHLCGDRITTPPLLESELSIKFSIRDDDEATADYQVAVYSDTPGGEVARAVDVISVEGNTPVNAMDSIEDIHYTGPGQYVFFKITQFDEDGVSDKAWTSPVWFEQAGSPTENAEETFVASKNSEVYHISNECVDARRIKPANRVTGEAAKKGRRLHDGCPRK